jgi:hypothetical protein
MRGCACCLQQGFLHCRKHTQLDCGVALLLKLCGSCVPSFAADVPAALKQVVLVVLLLAVGVVWWCLYLWANLWGVVCGICGWARSHTLYI